jgi:uncharacterized membrane protein (DUF4010 family)
MLAYLVPPFIVGLAALLAGWRRTSDELLPPAVAPNPLQFKPALQMAALFQAVMFGVEAIRSLFGHGALLVSGAVLGLTDVDALTISMCRIARDGVPAALAAEAIAIGVLANAGMKVFLAVVLGTAPFRRAAIIPLAAMAAAIVISLGIGR